MGNLVKKPKKENKEILFKEFDFLSMFDEQFLIDDFEQSIQRGNKESDTIISKAKAAVKNAFNDTDECSYHYEVSMSDDMKQAIEQGEVSLVTGNDGKIYALLRGEKGQFGKPLPIEKQMEEQGISAEQLELAIQMEAIRSQLESMISTLKTIEGRITDVIQGQHNDRIGLFYSGLSLYTEAQNLNDDVLRTQLQAQALKALSDANSQVIQEIRSCIEFLITEKYKDSNKASEEIEEKLASISKCYDVIYRATFLKATIYHEKGEINAMLTVIDEYGRFVQKLIIPYTGMLSELDSKEKFIKKGTWGKIADTLSTFSDMRKQLGKREELLLSMKGE